MEKERSILNTAGILVVVLDRQGQILRFNRACEEATGYAFDEVQGRCIWDLLMTPEEAEPVKAVFERARSARSPDEHENHWTTKDGGRRLISWSSTTLLDDQGLVEQVILTGVDVTEGDRAEEAPQHSRGRAVAQQDLLPVLSRAAASVQHAGTPDEVYQAVGDVVAGLGFDASLFRVADDGEGLALSHTTLEPSLLREAGEMAGLAEGGFRVPLSEGSVCERVVTTGETAFRERFAEDIAAALPEPLRPLAGRIATLLGVEQGVVAPIRVDGVVEALLIVSGIGLTEAAAPAVTILAHQAASAVASARLHEEMARLKEFSEDIVQNVVEVIILTDTAGCMTFVNLAVEALLGYTPEELVGKHWAVIVPLDQHGIVEEADVKRELGEEVGRYELQLTHKDNRRITVLVNANPRRDPQQGRFVGMTIALTDISQRKQGEKALRTWEAKYRRLFASIADPVFIFDQETGCFLDCNQSALDCYGYTLEELQTMTPQQLHLPEDWDQARGLTADSEGFSPHTYTHVTKQGKTLQVEVHTAPLEYEGRPAWVSIARDITERVQAEEEVRRRATHQEALNTIIAAAAAAADLPGLLRTALERTMAALGVSMGGIWVAPATFSQGVQQEVQDAIAEVVATGGLPVTRTAAVEDWQAPAFAGELEPLAGILLGGGIRASLTIPILAHDRHVGVLGLAAPRPRPWSAEEVALMEAVGRQLGAAVERLRLLERTREQAQQVQQIVDTVPEGVLLLDDERCILLANPLGQELVGILAGRAIGEVLSHLGGTPLEELLAPSGEGQHHEVEVAGPPRRVFEVLAEPMGVETWMEGWVLVIRDVTQEKEDQRRAGAQQRLAAMGQLAAGIAHDFNNVLQGIMTFAELLKNRVRGPQAEEQVDFICQLADRAARMNRQILDFTRQTAVEKRPLDLVPFAEEMQELLQHTIPKTIQVEFHRTPGAYWVNGDVGQLQQVLMNLASNARDAMPGGGKLSVSFSRFTLESGVRPPWPDMPAGEWIRIEVSDTGAGIPSGVLPHVFEPFFTTKERTGGTGLGLSQVYGIVKQHGGFIDVETELGAGTSVIVYLPALEEEEKAGAEEAEVARVEPGSTVLVVEDEPLVLAGIKAQLEQLGYRVLTAANGRQGLKVYDLCPGDVDVVLTDLVMPEMGGAELLQALKDRGADVGVIVMTGYPLERQSRDTLAWAGAIWLEKPARKALLAQALRDLLS